MRSMPAQSCHQNTTSHSSPPQPAQHPQHQPHPTYLNSTIQSFLCAFRGIQTKLFLLSNFTGHDARQLQSGKKCSIKRSTLMGSISGKVFYFSSPPPQLIINNLSWKSSTWKMHFLPVTSETFIMRLEPDLCFIIIIKQSNIIANYSYQQFLTIKVKKWKCR